MKNKVISLLLCIVLCLSLCIPALGAFNDDVKVAAALDQAELDYDANNDQTVTLTVKLSKSVELYSVYFEADLPSGLKLAGISGDIKYKNADYSLDTGVVSWYDSENTTVTNLAILKITAPKGTKAGEYEVGVKEIELATAGENNGDNWMEGGKIYATLTIRESEPEPEEIPEYKEALNAVEEYLAATVTNPKVNSTYGEWAVLALNRGGVAKPGWNDTYLENLKAHVDKLNGVLSEDAYTEYSRVILALTSMGVDASSFETDKATYDLVTPLLDKDKDGTYIAEIQGNNGTIFALLALDSHGYLPGAEGKAARADFIASLKENQMESGAWSISGGGANTDTTAAAIYALAPYYLDKSKLKDLGGSVTYAEVQDMVDRALEYLSGIQKANGGFGSPEADSWVVIALATLGRDAAADKDFVKENGSVLDDLLRYFDESTGGFKNNLNGKTNQMSTEEAAYALVAYDRFKNGENTLFDMSDVSFGQKQDDKDDPLVTVTFHLQGGKSDVIKDGEEKTYTKGDEGKALPKPTKDNYSFEGWFDLSEGGTKYTSVSANLPEDLYAQWKSSGGGGGGGSSEDKIKVTFRLIGAEKADKKVDLGKEEYMPDYVTWVATTKYEMDEGDTVYDLWVKATRENRISSIGAEDNYIKTVYAPESLGGYALSEFTNGPRSGWMYTINGSHPGYGLVEQELHDGDRIIFHYVNDYSYEVPDWFESDSSLGDGSYYSRWLKAPDRVGASGGGLGAGAKGGSGDSGSSSLEPTIDGDTIWLHAEVEHSEGGSAYAADAKLTKETAEKGLEKAKDKSKLKVWVEIEDSNRLVLSIEPEAVQAIAKASAGLRVGCSRGVIEIDGEAVAKMSELGGEARITISYDDWYEKTRLSVTVNHQIVDVMMKVELPALDDIAAVFIVGSDGSLTVIRKSAVVNDRAYANVPSGSTVQIIGQRKFYYDVKAEDWFANAVYFVNTHELMNSVEKRAVFAPNDPMTRAMLVTVLFRLEDEPETDGSLSFADVKEDSWYADAVAWAAENGIVLGNGEGFAPNDNITREQIATILFRYAKHIGLDTSVSGNLSQFKDCDTISPWAQEAMAWAVGVSLFKGDDTGSLNPQGNATRAQVATLLMRLVKLIAVSR